MNANREYPYGLFAGVFRGWWLVACLAVIALLVYRDGLPDLAREIAYASLPDIEESFELWSRLGLATSFTDGFPAALLSLPGAWLVDRFGPRRVALYGLPAVVIGYLVLIGAEPVNWVMYLGIALSTIGAAVGFSWVPAAALNHWFHRYKATAMAVPLLCFGLWQSAIDPFVGSLTDFLGWRIASAAVGIGAVAVVMPLAWQIRDRPEDQGLYPDGTPLVNGDTHPDYTWWEAIRSRSFWLLVVGDGCLSAVGMGSLLLSGVDEFGADDPWGIGHVDTGRMVASTAAVLVCALIADRIPVRYVLTGLASVLAGALVLLPTGGAGSGFGFEVLLGVALGGSQAVRIAARGIYFGRRNFATIAATGVLLVLPFQLVAIPSLYGLYDLSGGTLAPLSLAFAGCLIGGLGYLLAGPPEPAPSQRTLQDGRGPFDSPSD